HLVFLPRGDIALTQRSRKYSGLSAVVVRFSRSRRRYERQGLLVELAALERGEKECLSDEEKRRVALGAGRGASRARRRAIRCAICRPNPLQVSRLSAGGGRSRRSACMREVQRKSRAFGQCEEVRRRGCRSGGNGACAPHAHRVRSTPRTRMGASGGACCRRSKGGGSEGALAQNAGRSE